MYVYVTVLFLFVDQLKFPPHSDKGERPVLKRLKSLNCLNHMFSSGISKASKVVLVVH